MRRTSRFVAALAVLAAGCGSVQSDQASNQTTTSATSTIAAPTTTTPFTSPTVDWNDRASVRIALPSGWTLTACEGDAPFLCAASPDGIVDGTIMLVEYPAAGGPFTEEEVERNAADLYRVTEDDRQATCGADFRLVPDALTSRAVGGKPGFRYGYQLVDATEKATEHVVLHVVVDGSRMIVINTAFSDPDGCPGEDPERIEFPIDAFAAIDPYLDQIVAASVLPLDAPKLTEGASNDR